MSRRSLMACGILALGLVLALVPPILRVVKAQPQAFTWEGLGRYLCTGLISWGLPSVNAPLPFPLGTPSDGQDAADSEAVPEGTVSEIFSDGEETADADAETTDMTAADDTAADDTAADDTNDTPSESMQGTPIITQDMSERDKGADHIACDFPCELPALSEGAIGVPSEGVVLIVHSHPYEAYGDGGPLAWQDEDGWAVETPVDGMYSDAGVVALGEQLALLLRMRGIEVIHAVLPAGSVPSHMDTYEQTQALVSELCLAHPRIAWVIDLRRGAEKLPNGSLLRTEGVYGGEAVAQLHLSVGMQEKETAWQRSLVGAVALRRWLYREEPTLSRPVTLRQGEGLGIHGDALLITAELGTAGNTFEEASRLLTPLANALVAVIKAE